MIGKDKAILTVHLAKNIHKMLWEMADREARTATSLITWIALEYARSVHPDLWTGCNMKNAHDGKLINKRS